MKRGSGFDLRHEDWKRFRSSQETARTFDEAQVQITTETETYIGLSTMYYLAEQDYIPAVTFLAKHCYDGTHLPLDKTKGIAYLKQAAILGDPESTYRLGRIYGRLEPVDLAMAAHYYKLAAEANHLEAAVAYAQCLLDGKGVEKDQSEGSTMLRHLANVYHLPKAIRAMGRMYEKGIGVVQDPVSAFRYYQIGSNVGDDISMMKTAWMLYTGTGIMRNDSLAVQYYKRLADKQLPAAQYNYGASLIVGRGLPLNISEGLRYIQMAADQKDIPAMYYLGVRHLYGRDGPIDKVKALAYFRQGAEAGHISSIAQLGRMQLELNTAWTDPVTGLANIMRGKALTPVKLTIKKVLQVRVATEGYST